MRRWLARASIGLLAVIAALLGLAGAYSYGQDYYLHRGFATIVQLPRAGTGRLLQESFYSRALHRKADYMVYLPPHYTASKRYPVYYLLHGMPGQPHVFVTIANMDVRLDNQISLGTVKPMILVYPDGRIGQSVFSDSEWANTPAGSYESYVIDVMHSVDSHFSTLRFRQDRVIAGFSAGGYGAINIALHHLADFGSVQAWSGYFLQTRSGVFAHASRAELAHDSPLDYVRRLDHGLGVYPLRVYMFVGRNDSSASQQRRMARALRARGVSVGDAMYTGGHDWSVWYPRLNQMLILASREVSKPPAQHLAGRSSAAASQSARRGPGRVRAWSVRQRARGSARRSVRVPGTYRRTSTLRLSTAAVRRFRHRRRLPDLLGALLLALVSAAVINLGFVVQHRGLAGRSAGGLAAAVRNRTWLAGQALGWVGFAGQILAIALAPLTLVQAFAAGSLAISVPLAARIFGYRVSRRQLAAVAIVAASLSVLPIGFVHHHGRLHAGVLIGGSLLALAAAVTLSRTRRPAALAIAAGVFYGVADGAIKADALAVHLRGLDALWSGWTILAALSTFGGFLSFQSALQREDAVRPITLMNAFSALTAVALGVIAFGESLGARPAVVILHVLAIALVLGCVRPLAAGQGQLVSRGAQTSHAAPAELIKTTMPRPGARAAGLRSQIGRMFVLAGAGVIAIEGLVVGCLVGTGLLYSLRGLHWLNFGPAVPDALPLLQLAGLDAQPLARVVAVWLAAGVILGLLMIWVRPSTRSLLVAIGGVLVMLLASDASFALARNLPLAQVMLERTPPFGAWFEGLLLAAGCRLPRSRAAHRLLGKIADNAAAPLALARRSRWLGGPAIPGRSRPERGKSRWAGTRPRGRFNSPGRRSPL